MPAWYSKGLRNKFATAILLAVALASLCLLLTPRPLLAADNADLLKPSSRAALATGSPLQSDTLLSAEEAFSLQVNQTDNHSFELQWTIKEGYYLYRDKLDITASSNSVIIDELPAGIVTHDDYFGDVEIYRHNLSVELTGQEIEEDVEITINYQGCAENRYCYPPETRSITLPF